MPLFGPNIKKMKEKGDVEALINALRNDNPEICVEAAEALMDFGDPKAVELLLKEFHNMLKLGVEADKVEAITIMQGCPTGESLGAIALSLGLADDRFKRIRKFEKAKFRKKFQIDVVRPILIDVAADSNENPFIRWYAVTALSELGDRSEEVLRLLLDSLNAIPRLNSLIIEESVRVLSYFVSNPDVTALLIKIQKGEALKTVDGRPQSAAIYALGAIGSPQAREYLEYLAARGDKFYRKRAQLALKLFGKANYDEIKAKAKKEIID